MDISSLVAVIGMGQSSWLVGPGSRSKPGEPSDLAYDAEPHRFTPACVRCGCDGCCAGDRQATICFNAA